MARVVGLNVASMSMKLIRNVMALGPGRTKFQIIARSSRGSFGKSSNFPGGVISFVESVSTPVSGDEVETVAADVGDTSEKRKSASFHRM